MYNVPFIILIADYDKMKNEQSVEEDINPDVISSMLSAIKALNTTLDAVSDSELSALAIAMFNYLQNYLLISIIQLYFCSFI